MREILCSPKRPANPALAAYLLAATTALICALSSPASAARHHKAAETPSSDTAFSASPGTVVRWSAPDSARCGKERRTWPALDGVCYYPIDLLAKPGRVKITRSGGGHTQSASVTVGQFDYPTQEVDLGDIPQANPTHEEMKRALREEAVVNKIFARKEGPALFTLPLGAPANPLPAGRDFGSKRVFNDTAAGQPHMGADYTIVLGTPVHAVAAGTVMLAEDQFFSGNGVFIDHGDGLVSMYFHLSKIDVKPGQTVKKGETIGQVGSTGRSSGAHLYFGVRWHNARINPQLLLESRSKIPALDADPSDAKTAKRD